MILKAISFLYGWIKNFNFKKVEIVDTETKEERLKICNSCPFEDDEVCNICGCILESKAIFKNEKCPIDKWS